MAVQFRLGSLDSGADGEVDTAVDVLVTKSGCCRAGAPGSYAPGGPSTMCRDVPSTASAKSAPKAVAGVWYPDRTVSFRTRWSASTAARAVKVYASGPWSRAVVERPPGPRADAHTTVRP